MDVADLAPAAAKAAQAAIDAAVTAGHLTAAQAERLKKRVAASDAGACSKLVDRIGKEPSRRPASCATGRTRPPRRSA